MKFISYFLLIHLIIYFSSCSNTESKKNCLNENWSDKMMIEGKVESYKPMKAEGHGSKESFLVKNTFFSYSDYLETGFFNNSCVKGGPICENGQSVRITYRSKCNAINEIVTIEVLNQDSIVFKLIDSSIEDSHDFKKFKLILKENNEYWFQFEIMGYFAVEEGIYDVNNDTLILESLKANTKRYFLFVQSKDEARFYASTNSQKYLSSFLTSYRLNLDQNVNNPQSE